MSIRILNNRGFQTAEELTYELAESLAKRKQRRHELWILSCYVDLDLLEEYIDNILDIVRLTDIYLAFNFSELYKLGPLAKNTLDSIQKKLKKKSIKFEWKALVHSDLVHSKGYALIQKLGGELADGFVLITSANFTKPGFQGKNIEIGYISTKKRDVISFKKNYKHLWNSLGYKLDKGIFKKEEYLLKFALLSSGVFLYKWSGNLRQDIGIKYKLTEFAKGERTMPIELEEVGFEFGDTFTRQVLDLDDLPQKEVPRSFIKDFTIETYWGRWCPFDAWNTLCESFKGADDFISKFKDVTEKPILLKIKKEALKTQEDLIKKGLIKKVGEDHLERWVDRILAIRKNKRRLERFFTGYEANELPYNIEQQDDVVRLFESMREGIELSSKKNGVKKKMSRAIFSQDPSCLRFDDSEKEKVKECLYKK